MHGDSGPPDGRAARVVIVDDSEVLVETLVASLAGHPALEVVATALDGAAGLAAVAETRPDVVLMDLRLGDAWGVDLVPAMRAGDHPPAVVVYTAAADAGTADAIERAGAAAHLVKGAALQEVVATLVDAASRRAQRPQS